MPRSPLPIIDDHTGVPHGFSDTLFRPGLMGHRSRFARN
jgi:hypothetical protein